MPSQLLRCKFENFILFIKQFQYLSFQLIFRIATTLLTTLVLIGTIIETYKLLRTQKKAHNKFKNETNNILLLENKANEEIQIIEDNNIDDLQSRNDETVTITNQNSSDSQVSKKDYNTIKRNDTVIVQDLEKKSFFYLLYLFFSLIVSYCLILRKRIIYCSIVVMFFSLF